MYILNNKLDKYQEEIVKLDYQNLLVIAGAGSGKTFTILAKIKYLVTIKKIDEKDIITITFTNNSNENLKQKLNKEGLFNVRSYTFHKLAIEILNEDLKISDDELLFDVINKFFYIDVLEDNNMMRLILNYFGTYIISNIKNTYNKFIQTNEKEINYLMRQIKSFINRYKTNNYTLEDFNIFLNKIKTITNIINYYKEKKLLIIILNIYIKYITYLNENNESDFDDLIINATKKVENSAKFNNIKYIIIDEYQDISYIRLLLVKEIIKKTNCKLMAVGDDYQAIYGFSGSNISFFVEFTNYFPHSKIMFLKYTYRNSQELIDIATKFIMKNKYQIKKEMKSNKTINSPIKIIYYKNIRKEIKRILNNIEGNILILGRNNKDVNYILDEEIVLNNTKIKYKDKTIEYMSVHKSKGLEYDNVILINMRNDTLGFPSRVIENKIFRLFKNEEYYKDAEERRLFYVALTRTKNNVFILAPKINSSPFIFELEKIIKSCNCNKKKNMAMLE